MKAVNYDNSTDTFIRKRLREFKVLKNKEYKFLKLAQELGYHLVVDHKEDDSLIMKLERHTHIKKKNK